MSLTDLPKTVIKELDRFKGIFLAYTKNVIKELDRTKGIFLAYTKNVIKELDRTKGIFLAYTKNADIKREKLLSRQSWVHKLVINTQKILICSY